ncbi:MAG TPA: DNA alkylation repair protein [Candidatus Krumholzibacteria bacterium]
MNSTKKKPKKKVARRDTRARTPRDGARGPLQEEVQAALSSLKKMSTPRDRENLARFGITASKAFGVSMANIQVLAKRLGRNHDLAAALWDTGWYEARMLTSFVDEPARVTPAQMDRWCLEFDNWGICDTLCFCLFDRTPHAWAKVAQWSDKRDEFVKRAAFALLASLAGHDKSAGDERFVESLRFIERAAGDERNFVKKGVSWALRRIGRRNAALNAAAVTVARRLSVSPESAARWVGRGALKELTSPAVVRQLAARRRDTRG